MAVSEEARYIEGVWGPYDSGAIPEFWLNEVGSQLRVHWLIM